MLFFLYSIFQGQMLILYFGKKKKIYIYIYHMFKQREGLKKLDYFTLKKTIYLFIYSWILNTEEMLLGIFLKMMILYACHWHINIVLCFQLENDPCRWSQLLASGRIPLGAIERFTSLFFLVYPTLATAHVWEEEACAHPPFPIKDCRVPDSLV